MLNIIENKGSEKEGKESIQIVSCKLHRNTKKKERAGERKREEKGNTGNKAKR